MSPPDDTISSGQRGRPDYVTPDGISLPMPPELMHWRQTYTAPPAYDANAQADATRRLHEKLQHYRPPRS